MPNLSLLKTTQISVLNSFARLQADGKLKNVQKLKMPSQKMFNPIVNVKGLFDTFRDLHSKL